MELVGTKLLFTVLFLLATSGRAAAKVTSLIDAYSPTSVLSSPATVPLGTTVVLVCRVGGVASGTQLSYTWTCPKQHCNLGPDQGPSLHRQTFEDRMVITAMSTNDSGDYTCLVHDHLGETLSTERFTLTVTGRLYLFSNRRLIPENAVITNMGTINASRGGVISCYSPPGRGTPVWSGPPGVNLTTIPHPEGEGTVSLVINQDNFTNGQYCCRGGGDTRCVNFYTTSGRGTLPKPRINALVDDTGQLTLIATLSTVQSVQRLVASYSRQDLGVPLTAEYIVTNVDSKDDYVISKPPDRTVSGASYRITVWALNGEGYSAEPFTHTLVLRNDKAPSAPRSLTLARVISDGYELSWIPPQEPHGEVQYRIKLTNKHNGTEVEVNTTSDHYNMTGLVPGVTYRATVAAINSVGVGAESEAILWTTIPLETSTETSTTPTEPQDTDAGGVIAAVTLVTFVLLVGVTVTVTLLVVLLGVRCRQSGKKGHYDLPRDPSLYSTADHSYATVYAATEHYNVIREGIVTKVPDTIRVPLDVGSVESGYQELMGSAVQRTTYAHLYSYLPPSKKELVDPGTQGTVELTEAEWNGEEMSGGEGDEQENQYVNAAYKAAQGQS